MLPAPHRISDMSSSRFNQSSAYVMPQVTSTGNNTPGQEVQSAVGAQTEQEGWFSLIFRIPPVVRGSAQLDDGVFVEYFKEQDGTTVVHGRIPWGRNQSNFVRANVPY